MTTHRLIQIHNLLDNAQSKARAARKGSANLARIGNTKGAEYFWQKAVRFERIAKLCAARLGVV